MVSEDAVLLQLGGGSEEIVTLPLYLILFCSVLVDEFRHKACIKPLYLVRGFGTFLFYGFCSVKDVLLFLGLVTCIFSEIQTKFGFHIFNLLRV